MRLFVAINLPDELRRELGAVLRPLRDGGLPSRWVAPEQYHVTMKFIGETTEDRRDEAREALRRIVGAYRPFEARLDGLGAFPSLRRPRVIWVGVDPSAQLRSLKHDLEHGFVELGVERETRAFRPHVTVGRADSDAAAAAFRPLERFAEGFDLDATFEVASVELMRSRLRPDGPVYAVEDRAPMESGA